jgi:DNA/RNA-binding domain of Phe-tRNA-synthetase-like protein
MAALEFTIAPEVLRRFPGIEVHAVRARGFRTSVDRLDHAGQLRAATARVATLGIDRNAVAAYPPIARWREGYAAMKVRPSQFRASIESLLRRALAGGDLALPIPAVNLYNAVSLDGVAPMGAYDMAKLPAAPMEFRLARPATDRFVPLAGKVEDFPLSADLVVYAAGDTVLCWGFNHRDNIETALDAESDDIVFFSEALDREDGARSASAVEEIRKRLDAVDVACSTPVMANKGRPGFQL